MINNYVGARTTTVSFDTGLKFHLGDMTAAQSTTFDDSSWTGLDVPHDWSISLAFKQSSAATFEGGYLDGGPGVELRVLHAARVEPVELTFATAPP